MKITIIIEDENLNYFAKAETGSFETVQQHLASLEKNYTRRVQMELDKADVAAEAGKESF